LKRKRDDDGESNEPAIDPLPLVELEQQQHNHEDRQSNDRLQLALVDASKEVVPISQFFQKLIFVINTVD
jgi:hypothetical protein